MAGYDENREHYCVLMILVCLYSWN